MSYDVNKFRALTFVFTQAFSMGVTPDDLGRYYSQGDPYRQRRCYAMAGASLEQ
jgi:hypothetical protein